MDELEISGRRYISSARAAKEHKYHADYIGQLVRGGKVAGQKVGRAWYVDADSLSEYLGKEVPARGPVPKVIKSKVEPELTVEEVVSITKVKSVGSEEKSVAEPIEVRGFSSDLPEQEIERESFVEETAEPSFVLPLRKSGRAHVIAAIENESKTEIVKPVFEEKIVEEKFEEPIVVELPEENDEEETFIPLKITKEKPKDLYREPEDSFYKVSRKGLRYVRPGAAARTAVPERIAAASYEPAKQKNTGGKVVGAISLVLVAGILSLGAGVLMSYYLHSITTVKDATQTSSVILSN